MQLPWVVGVEEVVREEEEVRVEEEVEVASWWPPPPRSPQGRHLEQGSRQTWSIKFRPLFNLLVACGSLWCWGLAA